MVRDEVRNNIFYDAIAEAVRTKGNDSIMIEAGAGSGLLSMMAADLGVSNILAVEASSTMFLIAKQVLRRNNFSITTSSTSDLIKSGKDKDKRKSRFKSKTKPTINLVEGYFEDLQLGHKYLTGPADIFVSETFDSSLIGEKFLSILSHTKAAKLLKSDVVVVPHAATVMVQLLESKVCLSVVVALLLRPPPLIQWRINFRRFVQLSLPHSADVKIKGGNGIDRVYNLEPMRIHRPSDVFGVNYINDHFFRRSLSEVHALFRLDFQAFATDSSDPSVIFFDYNCLVFTVRAREFTHDGGGGSNNNSNSEAPFVLDTLGIWFNLDLNQNKTLTLSNSPYTDACTSAPIASDQSATSSSPLPLCSLSEDVDGHSRTRWQSSLPPHARQSSWMQAFYRLPLDVSVRVGDMVRLQVVRAGHKYIVSSGLPASRLIKFESTCVHRVDVYLVLDNHASKSDEDDDDDDDHTGGGQASTSGRRLSEELLGSIPPAVLPLASVPPKPSWRVFQAQVNQVFKLVTQSSSSGKQHGMYYKLEDSEDKWQPKAGYENEVSPVVGAVGGKKGRRRRREGAAVHPLNPIPLDTYTIDCPS